ncbi:MAG: hypothetical protein IT260_15850 [Saprospiraceae bacterium]|nr:hypothetical protein [Saprospiraceae bacterium]
MKNGLFIAVLALVCSANWALAQQPNLQYFRPWDQSGINVFEPSKKAEQPEFTGFKIRIGGSFTQDFQSLTHENSPTYAPVSGTNATNKNLLYGVIKSEDSTSAKLSGFNLAMANLNLDFQIADGIRVGLENYMSSRHHSEFWVKGGYIQIDKLPMLGNPKWFADYLRVKIGHFQPNFGDMQFRRTDGGNAMYNPFVENYILDAFATEIGGEVYLFPVDGVMAMVGMSSGFINGNVENYPDANNSSGVVPTKKTPSIFAKVAYDKAFTDDFRFRLSASLYTNSNIQRNTLYAGDRTGSHYFLVMEPALQSTGVATAQGTQFTSGRFNPDVPNRVQAIMINPFIKFKGLEIFGSYEIINGSNYADVSGPTDRKVWDKRNFTQISAEGVYRFLPREQMYVGARYTQMTGEPRGILDSNGAQQEVSVNRLAFAAGWFPTHNLLLKGEYVIQKYEDFPTSDYRNAGKFSGFVVEAVIGF